MSRILMRAGKVPYQPANTYEVLKENLVASNTGNILFAHSVYRALDVPGCVIDVNRYRVNPIDSDRINEEYDAFVIPLANAFRPSFMKQLELLTSLVEKLKIPCVVVGVGAQTNLRLDLLKESPIDKTVKRFVKAVLDRSATIGVRGEITREYLAGLGFDAVETIGCPSMYLNGPNLSVDKRAPSLHPNSHVAANFTRGMPENVCNFFRRSWKKYRRISYVAQDKDDIELLLWGKPISGIKAGDAFPAKLNHPLLSRGQTRLFFDFQTWSDHLEKMDFVFGTRIHGNVAGLLSGVPGFLIAHDSRTLELAEYFDIPFIKSSDVDDATDIADLYLSSSYEKMVAGHQPRFERYLRFLEKNGLEHNYRNDDGPRDFDERLAAAEFAPGLDPISTAMPSEIGHRLTKFHAILEKENLRRLKAGSKK